MLVLVANLSLSWDITALFDGQPITETDFKDELIGLSSKYFMNVSTSCSMFKAGAKITGTYKVKLHYDKLKLKIRACCCLKITKICILPRMTVANDSSQSQ